MLRIVLYVFIVVVALLSIVLSVFGYNNLNYDVKAMKQVNKAGFTERLVELDNGLVINYAEGPDNGPNLLLIHGQTMVWEDYANVLPQLSRNYHVYAIDCYGHGDSSKVVATYSCEIMGEDINWFIERVMGDKCVISGHSSGGILAAWIAANYPENIEYLVLEDPPFFSVTPEEMQNTFVWLDGFKLIHDYHEQTEIENYTEYYMKNSYFWGLFGELQPVVEEKESSYMSEHEGEP